MAINIPPSGTPLIDNRGLINPAWYRYFVGLSTASDAAVAGEVGTADGSGLEGGGAVSEGINLSIALNGVTDAMIRQGLPCSVIGRCPDTEGNVADIQATVNRRVLTREDDILAFRDYINGVSIGVDVAAPLVKTDSLELTETPASSTATVTHSIEIQCDGSPFYVLLSSTP